MSKNDFIDINTMTSALFDTFYPNRMKGFFEYRYKDWKMIYNPTTKEIYHIQPKSYK